MIIDEKGKLFGKVSIIDLLIVGIILAGIAGLVYKFNPARTVSPFAEEDKMQVVFYTESMPDYVADAIKEGDTAVDPVKGAVFGKVKEIIVDEAVEFVSNDEGEIVVSSKPGYVSSKIVVEGQGVYSDFGFKFDNVEYVVGKSFELRLGNSGGIWTRISKIKKLEE